MQTIFVGEVCEQSEMRALVVDKDMSLTDAVKQFATNHNLRGIFITGDAGRLVGVIWPEDVIQRYEESEQDEA